MEVALKIMKAEKKRPGRPRFMKAGMSEHIAKTTAREVKHMQARLSICKRGRWRDEEIDEMGAIKPGGIAPPGFICLLYRLPAFL